MHSSIRYQSYRLDWRGFEIEIRYCPEWTSSMRVAHIEVESVCRSPLPITDTGYRSLFINADLVEELGGATSFVEHWLNEETEDSGWKSSEDRRRQFSLF
jgi:hypothetical protein